MKDNEVGRRVREQVGRFSGIFSPRFSKPQAQFVEQMIFGIQAAQDVKLSTIGRALGESIALKKTEERLSHHLAAAYFAAVWLGERLRLAVLCRRVAKLAKRFFGVPEFHYYALADGIHTLLSRLGRWIPRQNNLAQAPSGPQQMLLI